MPHATRHATHILVTVSAAPAVGRSPLGRAAASVRSAPRAARLRRRPRFGEPAGRRALHSSFAGSFELAGGSRAGVSSAVPDELRRGASSTSSIAARRAAASPSNCFRYALEKTSMYCRGRSWAGGGEGRGLSRQPQRRPLAQPQAAPLFGMGALPLRSHGAARADAAGHARTQEAPLHL